MAKIAKITKEIIISKAYLYIKEEGIDKLNVRALSKYIGCSTQPMYNCFSNMSEFKNELYKYCKKEYITYIESNKLNSDSYFMGYMIAYLKYASSFPNVFEFLFMKEKYKKLSIEEDHNQLIINGIKMLGYSEKEATEFFNQTSIFAFGLAVECVTKHLGLCFNQMEELLRKEFEILKKYYRS